MWAVFSPSEGQELSSGIWGEGRGENEQRGFWGIVSNIQAAGAVGGESILVGGESLVTAFNPNFSDLCGDCCAWLLLFPKIRLISWLALLFFSAVCACHLPGPDPAIFWRSMRREMLRIWWWKCTMRGNQDMVSLTAGPQREYIC